MFIIANFKVITIALLAAIPFYFFNRYLLQNIRPKDSGKRLISYFVLVLITATIYSLAAVLTMIWIGYKGN